MIEKVKGLSIQGRCFPNEKKLNFYPQPNDRISVVYGKNGSGKSTISEGFLSFSQPNVVSDISVSLLDEQKNIIQPSIEANNICVFNESYIDNNVKIDDDGLGTIVLLGGQVNLQSEIDKYEQMEKICRAESDTAQGNFEQYNQPENPVSPSYHWERMRNILKQPGGWAEIDSKVKGYRRNSSVTDDVINEICALSTTLTPIELQRKYNDTKELLEKVSASPATFPIVIKQISYAVGMEKNICTLLAKQIERPILTEREKLILSAIQVGRQSMVEAARKDFIDTQIKICPYCYQPVEEDYKHALIESIDRVLNKEVNLHKQEFQDIAFPQITLDYSQYSSLDSDLVQKIVSQANVCNSLIKQYEEAIKEKVGNIYTPIILEEKGLESSLIVLNSLLNELETKRNEFNDAASRSKLLQKELLNINKLVAHLQIVMIYKDYQKQEKAKKTFNNILDEKQKRLKDASEHLRILKQRKANTGLAISQINNALDYVFFMHDRLSIELRNDKYFLKSNGHDVRPKNVSLGERNIIALCYFFTQIMANQEISQLYQREKLVVIDDPVSSFDFENKVGIISLLRYQINRIVKGNKHSKILILSHDLATIFDLGKAMDEICKSTKGDAHICTTTYSSFELSDGQLKRFAKSRSEYSELLQMTYGYANGDIDESNILIGNAMRRVLEAFSTFTYKKSIEDVSCDVGVLKMLGDHSTYFENLMYRLVLHGESHYEEQIYNLHDDVSFYQFISDAEKKRTAKDVLCFMYLLNPSHIEAYLQTKAHAIENINEWAKDIPTNSSFEITESPLELSKMRIIKLYDLPLSAGVGNDIYNGDIPYEEYETQNSTCDFALKIKGDSMEPDIPNGSIVLIKKCDTLEDGKIGAFYYNGEVYCKKLRQKEQTNYLVSVNTTYPPIPISKEDTIVLYGEVVSIA